MSEPPIPATMRCILQPDIQDFRPSSLISTRQPTPLPDPSSPLLAEHLVRVHATCPCAGELRWAADYPATVRPGRQAVPCYDLAGVVARAPAGSRFAAGTPVYGYVDTGRTGNAREYTLAAAAELARAPRNVPLARAASVPLSAITAYQALFVHGTLHPAFELGRDEEEEEEEEEMKGGEGKGQGEGEEDKALVARQREENATKRVLVTAAAGGVGVWAMQLARLAGVRDIVAVVGTGNVDFIKELGASEVIDYKKQTLGDWARENTKVDLLLDMVGRDTLAQAWTSVKQGGMLISVYEDTETRKPSGSTDLEKDVRSKFFILEPDGLHLETITLLIESGQAKPFVDSEWEFDDFQKAFAKVESGHARGKVVLKIS